MKMINGKKSHNVNGPFWPFRSIICHYRVQFQFPFNENFALGFSIIVTPRLGNSQS